MTVEQVKHIWENCPKSVEKLIAWYKRSMSAPATGNPQIDGPMQEIIKNAEEALKFTLALPTPVRALYDFFDENGIYISILDTELNWKYILTYDLTASHSDKAGFNTRPEAENVAFYTAFSSLELKLK